MWKWLAKALGLRLSNNEQGCFVLFCFVAINRIATSAIQMRFLYLLKMLNMLVKHEPLALPIEAVNVPSCYEFQMKYDLIYPRKKVKELRVEYDSNKYIKLARKTTGI